MKGVVEAIVFKEDVFGWLELFLPSHAVNPAKIIELRGHVRRSHCGGRLASAGPINAQKMDPLSEVNEVVVRNCHPFGSALHDDSRTISSCIRAVGEHRFGVRR